MKWLLRVLGAIVAVVGVAALVGAVLPRNHVASSPITLRQPQDSVRAAIRDLGAVPSWWSDVKRSDRLPDQDGRERWEQQTGMGSMPLEITESQPPSRLVTRIASPPGAAFGGTWTYEIAATDGGSRITITEDGWMDGYLRALGTRFGETVEPQRTK